MVADIDKESGKHPKASQQYYKVSVGIGGSTPVAMLGFCKLTIGSILPPFVMDTTLDPAAVLLAVRHIVTLSFARAHATSLRETPFGSF